MKEVSSAARRHGSMSRSASAVRERGGDLPCQRGGAVQPRHRMGDGPPEQTARGLHRQQGGDRARPGGHPAHGDPAGVASEGGDVALYPLQRRDLVEESAVGRHVVEERESLRAHAAVDGHHDDPRLGQRRRVVHRVARRRREIAAHGDPHQHRQSRRAGVRGADVERQPVGALRGHVDRQGQRHHGAELDRLPRPLPAMWRRGSGEAERSDRRLGVGDAAEHRVPLPPEPLHHAFRGPHLWLFGHDDSLPRVASRLWVRCIMSTVLEQ